MPRAAHIAAMAEEQDRIVKRSVTIAGHRTSVSLEEAFWRRLKRFAAMDGVTVAELIAEIDAGRSNGLSSAIRLYVLNRVDPED